MNPHFGRFSPTGKTRGAARVPHLPSRTSSTAGTSTGDSGTDLTPRGPGRSPNAAATMIKTRRSFVGKDRQPPDHGQRSPTTSPRQSPPPEIESPPAPPNETEVVQGCQQLFSDGQASKAIHQLDAALQKIRDTDAQHHLLAELAPELINLIDHDQPGVVLQRELKACLGRCRGIGQAIRAMNKAGWCLPTQRYFIEPRIRHALMELSDRRSAVKVIARQLNLQFEDAKGLVAKDDFEVALYRLEHWLHLASRPMNDAWLLRVLEHAQKLSAQLAEHTDEAFTPLKAQCERLTKDCLRLTEDGPNSGTLRARYGIRSRLELGGQVDIETGQWRWTKVEYPIETLLSPKEAHEEQLRFFADIDRLLKGPQPVPWTLAVKAVIATLRKLHWVPDYRVWLSWTLNEARRGHMEPMLEQLKKTEAELDDLKARNQLFLCLGEQIKAGMPWSEKTAITDAVQGHKDLGWGLRANDEWDLHLLCARAGDAQPMIDLLNSQLPLGFVEHARLEALLTLCQGTRLQAGARIDLIAAIRPHLGNAPPELGQQFDALLRTFQWRASVRAPSSVQASNVPTAEDELVRQTRKTMRRWFTIDTRQAPLVTVQTSHHKAPASAEQKEQFEAALLTWMNIELLQGSMSWQQLMGCLDEIERVWHQTIDRDLLLHLCIQHVERTGDPKALQDHLPKLIETQASDPTLLELLAIAGRADWNPIIRAALLPHLLAGLRPRHSIALHIACVQAILSLPAVEGIRAKAIDRFVTAYGGDEAMSLLFDTAARQHDKHPPALKAALRMAPRPPADPGAWMGWRALCRAWFDGMAPRLLSELANEQTQEKTAALLFDALSTLATPESGHQELAIRRLFDLLGELAQAVPLAQRADFLEHLLTLSLSWPGAPVVQAALRGALQALVAQERGATTSRMLAPNTNQLVIDDATALFSHGFVYWMALQRKEEEKDAAQACLEELQRRWGRSPVRSHAPDMAALIARLFDLQNPQ